MFQDKVLSKIEFQEVVLSLKTANCKLYELIQAQELVEIIFHQLIIGFQEAI